MEVMLAGISEEISDGFFPPSNAHLRPIQCRSLGRTFGGKDDNMREIGIAISEAVVTIINNKEALSALAQFIAALAAFLGFSALAIQIWITRRWNKRNFDLSFFPKLLEFENMADEIQVVTGPWSRIFPLDLLQVRALVGEDLNEGEIDKLNDISKRNNVVPVDISRWRAVGVKLKTYLNLIEAYSTAINEGVADCKFAKSMYLTRFVVQYRKLKPYIEYIQNVYKVKNVYCEFGKVVDKWTGTNKHASCIWRCLNTGCREQVPEIPTSV